MVSEAHVHAHVHACMGCGGRGNSNGNLIRTRHYVKDIRYIRVLHEFVVLLEA